MKIIYFLFIFGLLNCSELPGVYDIWYNYDYSLVQNYNPKYTYYPFRLPLNGGDKMDIQIKVPKKTITYFHIVAYEYSDYPKDNDVISHYLGHELKCPTQSDTDAGEYIIYYFTVVSHKGYNYLTIDVTIPNYSYTYLIFTVDLRRYKYSDIHDLKLNENYHVPVVGVFNDELIPNGYQIYIRISSFSQDNMEIQLKTDTPPYNKRYDFRVDVCQYSEMPTGQQVYYGDKNKPCSNDIPNTSTLEREYYYPFSTENNVNYLSIRITNNLRDFKSLDIFIYSETGMAVALLVVIIVLPILVVGGIVYFILKKLGICK